MYEKIEHYIQNNQNKVIAIDGPSGSGKSRLARRLEETYDVLVFHTDDYFLHPNRKTRERLSTPGGNLDIERMKSEIFDSLNEKEITSHHFNCFTNKLEVRKPFVKKSIIIVEGVYSLHPMVSDFYDFKVFLDIDREVQLSRVLERSGAVMLERFKQEWIPLEDAYFEHFSIRNQVDFYLKNQ